MSISAPFTLGTIYQDWSGPAVSLVIHPRQRFPVRFNSATTEESTEYSLHGTRSLGFPMSRKVRKELGPAVRFRTEEQLDLTWAALGAAASAPDPQVHPTPWEAPRLPSRPALPCPVGPMADTALRGPPLHRASATPWPEQVPDCPQSVFASRLSRPRPLPGLSLIHI